MWLDVLGQSHPARTPCALGNGAESVFLVVTDSSQRVPLFSCRQGPESRTVTPLPSSTSSTHLRPLLSHLGAETPVSRSQRDPRLDGHPRPKHCCPDFLPAGDRNPRGPMSGRVGVSPEPRSKARALKSREERSLLRRNEHGNHPGSWELRKEPISQRRKQKLRFGSRN